MRASHSTTTAVAYRRHRPPPAAAAYRQRRSPPAAAAYRLRRPTPTAATARRRPPAAGAACSQCSAELLPRVIFKPPTSQVPKCAEKGRRQPPPTLKHASHQFIVAGAAAGLWAFQRHRLKSNVHIMALNLVRGVPLTELEKKTMLDILTPPPPARKFMWWS
ncbi:hypothetical protein KSP39_PZI019166 [Platanthera zijinensis]|uniref:Uncharacterized protein n=1 Tax=Platanthera zijinensis TaxID=2320716 RepID=A0AAP0FXT9_9ASPA